MFRIFAKICAAVLMVFCGSQAYGQSFVIDCGELPFSSSVPMQKCYKYVGVRGHPHAERIIWTGLFHDDNSSLAMSLYTSPLGMTWRVSEEQAAQGVGYRDFYRKYPGTGSLAKIGDWLRFPAVVITSAGDKSMNCTQFYQKGPPTPRYDLSWIFVASFCVSQADVPDAAIKLILDSLKVSYQFKFKAQ